MGQKFRIQLRVNNLGLLGDGALASGGERGPSNQPGHQGSRSTLREGLSFRIESRTLASGPAVRRFPIKAAPPPAPPALCQCPRGSQARPGALHPPCLTPGARQGPGEGGRWPAAVGRTRGSLLKGLTPSEQAPGAPSPAVLIARDQRLCGRSWLRRLVPQFCRAPSAGQAIAWPLQQTWGQTQKHQQNHPPLGWRGETDPVGRSTFFTKVSICRSLEQLYMNLSIIKSDSWRGLMGEKGD